MGDLRIDAHCLEHVRWIERPAAARGACRRGHSALAKQNKQRLGLQPLEADVGRVAHAVGGGDHASDRDGRSNTGLEVVAQLPDRFDSLRRETGRFLRRHAETNYCRDVLRPGPKPAQPEPNRVALNSIAVVSSSDEFTCLRRNT